MKTSSLHVFLLLLLVLSGCATNGNKQTLASLRNVDIEIKDEFVAGSLDKAMESYHKFLAETPESEMTPEAIRRLADLKIEKEYGVIVEPDTEGQANSVSVASVDSAPPATTSIPIGEILPIEAAKSATMTALANISDESQEQFEQRASQQQVIGANQDTLVLPAGENIDLQIAGAMEAIQLYLKLLKEYPLYEGNDQVLYQLSRAYEETGQVDQAMGVLNRLVVEYPTSRYTDEAQFRRAEYYFVRKRYLDAEEAYQAVLNVGSTSAFYDLALYKLGWAFFKQDMFEDALHKYIALLDYKVEIGYDFEQTLDQVEQKRIEDTYRVISLSFSYLGGADAVVDYFNRYGAKEYEVAVYSHLGEFYLEKRRYADAANCYNLYVDRNPLSKVAPSFHIRVIDIYKQGGFPKLVVEAKKNYATTYGLNSTYWNYFDINDYAEELAFLKANLVDLANHFHALYQNRQLKKFKQDNYREAIHWYQASLESFPEDSQAPLMNYQLAGLMLENNQYRDAALEYERTAYNYPVHDNAATAGHATVYAYREYLKLAPQPERGLIKQEIIRTSLKFSEYYPQHEKTIIVLVAAIQDLYALKEYAKSIQVGRHMLVTYPEGDQELRRSVWLVVAHASFDTNLFADAEQGYAEVLLLTPDTDKSRHELIENMAAAIYKQGEQALKLEEYASAADHFLRVSLATPTSKIRATAEYDGAAALIKLKDWARAAEVLEAFRASYPQHELQQDVTKRLAIVYKEGGQLLLAAREFERIEKEVTDDNLRREAMLQAAELYEKAEEMDLAIVVYHRFVRQFSKPVEFVIETRQKIADIYKTKDEHKKYIEQLTAIVKADAGAGQERTDRTRYLASKAALVLTEPVFETFKNIKLVKPFKKNLNKKKKHMKQAIDAYAKLLDYEVGEVTAATGFYIAEIYYDFSQSLMKSERPDKLNDLEMEQYELALEEQAYPFEEKAIDLHQKNIELLDHNIYNAWIDQSIAMLARLVPARYAKAEISSGYVVSVN